VASAAASERENRRGERYRVLSHGRIMAGGVVADCVVRDLSESGARLGVSRKVRLPQQFDLLFAGHGLELRARVRWRRGDYVGVSFCLEEQVAELVRENRRKHFILKA
jgi:hypothetical protein